MTDLVTIKAAAGTRIGISVAGEPAVEFKANAKGELLVPAGLVASVLDAIEGSSVVGDPAVTAEKE